jgi:molybdopterin synthase catalytic subunit
MGMLSPFFHRLVVVEMIVLTQEDFSSDEMLGWLKTDEMGALVTFTGIVRNLSKGRTVDRIEIQIYEDMARKQLEDIREEAIEKFTIEKVAIIHRYGNLRVSDNIMMIAVGSGHRAEAFDACRYIIDEIKKRVPIWKKEVTPEGDFWVEGDKP